MPPAPLPPPRPELLALLDAIKDHPDEDTPRLVLADWLDEQDNPLDAERAAFIREDIAASRSHRPSQHQHPFRPDQAELFRRWLGPVADFGSGRFVRGLPQMVVVGPWFLKPDTPALLATEAFAFVQFIWFDQVAGSRLRAIAESPALRHVPGVYLAPFTALGTRTAAKFLGSPNVSGLRQIEFEKTNIGAIGAQALAANPALARLRKLSLRWNKLVDKGVVALAASPHLARLEFLNLNNNLVGDAGAEAIAASPHLANLRELDLRYNPRLTVSGKRALRDKFGDRVKLD